MRTRKICRSVTSALDRAIKLFNLHAPPLAALFRIRKRALKFAETTVALQVFAV